MIDKFMWWFWTPVRRLAGRLFWETNLPLGPLAPYVLGLSMGRWPHKVPKQDA